MNIVDIVATIAFIATVIVAFKRGFVAEVKGFVAQIISLVLAYIFSPVLASKFYSMMPIEATIRMKVTSSIDSALSAVNASGSQYTKAINEGYNNFINTSGILKPFLSKVAERSDVADALKNTSTATKDLVVDTICKGCEPGIMAALNFISFIIILIIASIILGFVLSTMSNLLSKLTILGFANKLLGGVIGVFKGVVIALIAAGLTYLVCTLCKIDIGDMQSSFYLNLFGLL